MIRYGLLSREEAFELVKKHDHALDPLAVRDFCQFLGYTVLLKPTSPLRTVRHIDEAVEFFRKQEADAVVSVCEAEHSPLWCNTLPKDNSFVGFLPKIAESRSQDLPQYYRLNGAIYICNTKKLLEVKSFFLTDNIFAYIMDAEDSVDIDNPVDFYMAESIFRYKNEK